jgi:hypothetical protein
MDGTRQPSLLVHTIAPLEAQMALMSSRNMEAAEKGRTEMKKITLLIVICSLLVCAGSVSAQKRRRPSPVQEEFGDRISRDELSRKLEAADKESKRRRAREVKGNANSGQAVLDDLNNNFNQIVEAPAAQDYKLPQVDLSRLLGRRSSPQKEPKPKPATRQRKADPVMQEFGPAIRAQARRTEVARTSRAFDPSPFPTRRLPDGYKKIDKDPHRAVNPRKERERKAKAKKDGKEYRPNVDIQRFPIKPNAVVYDAYGKRLGRLSRNVRLNVDHVKRLVPQQIKINKNEQHSMRLPRGKREKFEMAVGVQLMNGQRVSGLVRREDIPRADRPKQARPGRLRAPGRETIPYAITGGDLRLPVPTRFAVDSRTNKRVPLKFQDPREKRPRGFPGMHQEANDYLPRPISSRRSNDQFYVNVLRTLPGRGGIARSVVKVDRSSKTFPIFDVFTNGTPRSRQLFLPGQSNPRGELTFLKGRLQGARANLGPVYIAVPNLSRLPVSPRKY